MRLSGLPIIIDEFPASADGSGRRLCNSGVGAAAAAVGIFVLTHFHTDHMKGLSSAWAGGVILTSTVTRQLLLSKFDGLRGRVVGLPYWCRTPLLSSATAGSAAPAVVHVTLLPAFHIPGSAMVYVETPSGATYLHTGDFKYAADGAAAPLSPLRTFFRNHRVDHLYLDDTWLHLGHAELMTPWSALGDGALHGAPLERQPPGSLPAAGTADSGVRVLSKLLDAAQVEEAIEAIGRRMDHQRQVHAQWLRREPQQHRHDATDAPSSEARPTREPFVVRVYLHNQFGKEMLVQQLAMRLRTRALIDDARYARLLAVVETLEEEREDLAVFAGSPAAAQAALSAEEQAWRAAGGEAAQYPYNLNCFVSSSQAHLPQTHPQQPQPLIEVVSSRAAIGPAALEAAATARAGTPHYGVVISGWARLQPQTRGAAASGQVWHVPTTLHSTPQEVIDFVALLRPLSATPLHYRPSRGAVVLQRLGPYLRTPFVNRHDIASAAAAASAGISGGVMWLPCLPVSLLLAQGIGGGGATASGCGVEGSPFAVDGLGGLEQRPQRGYRLRVPAEGSGLAAYFAAPGSGGGAAGGVACASISPVDAARDTPVAVAELLPAWQLRRVTQSYLNMLPGKRARDDAAPRAAGTTGRDAAAVDVRAVPALLPQESRSVTGTPVVEKGPALMSPSLSDLADELLA